VKIALAQINTTVGDVPHNTEKIVSFIKRARESGAQVVLFHELSIIGYPPKDLLLKPALIDRNLGALEEIAEQTAEITVLVGFAQKRERGPGRSLYNSVAVLQDRSIASTHHKSLLPTYDVFDEHRYFEPGPMVSVARCRDKKIGISICEDLWTMQDVAGRVLYHEDPILQQHQAGAEIFVNASASPFVVDKHKVRCDLLAEHAKRYQLPIVYVNQVGGNDELIFDGASCVYGPNGRLWASAKAFEEDLLIVDMDDPDSSRKEAIPRGCAAIYEALILGVRDYVAKCGFDKGVVIGLSGGIDSSVVAVIAAEALGRENVHGVAMPSRFSSSGSLADAGQLAANLGIDLQVIPIESMHHAFEMQLSSTFADRDPDVTEENIQARIRGTLLMALSNKFGYLLLSTGNKSELAMGYCTLYGDMAGGLAVISDVPKTMVYQLARYMNRDRQVIPLSVIEKPPSAELRAGQTDQDSLPPYDILDQILALYIEQESSAEQIMMQGFDPAVVQKVIAAVDRNEYKRKQTAVGLKVTSRAFGSGRRMPIAHGFRQSFPD